ncbi:MAG: aryl-sulfate sulfotransferase [Chloroflexota bacterium]
MRRGAPESRSASGMLHSAVDCVYVPFAMITERILHMIDLDFTSNPTITPNPNPTVPLAAVVTFTPSRPCETILSISDGANRWDARYASTHNPADGLPVVGLRPDRSHEIRVTLTSENGESVGYPEPLTITTPSLPAAPSLFPPLHIKASQPERMEPGLTLVFARRRIPGEPAKLTPEQRQFMTRYGLIIALDASGEVVWYFQTHARIADMIQLRNGNFLFLTTEFDVTEVDVLGNVVQEWYASRRPQGPHDTAIPVDAETIHHCIYELFNGNFMAFTANAKEVENYYTSEWDPDAPRKTQMVMGDTIIEFTREGKILWRWNCFDHLDPYRIGYDTLYSYWWVRGFPSHMDWSHGNSMWIDEEENTIILCLRHQEAILKIDRGSGEILWILGEHTDWSPELEKKLLQPVGEIQWPYRMHTPSITADGTFLIFDNGIFGARPFTMPKKPSDTYGRAAEYRIDEEAMTVEQIWASDQASETDNLVSYAMGDADFLSGTGNVLVSYGMAVTPEQVHDVPPNEYNRCSHVRGRSRVREVTRTSPPETVFDVHLRNDEDEPNVGWSCFGAERIERLI